MNLNAIANGIVRSVNPNIVEAVLMTNDGYTIDVGIQKPKYIESLVEIQAQSIESDQLDHLNLVTQQGQYNFVYINGLVSAQRRYLNKGEDMLRYKAYGEDNETTWKVVKVLESYADWVKLLVHRVDL